MWHVNQLKPQKPQGSISVPGLIDCATNLGENIDIELCCTHIPADAPWLHCDEDEGEGGIERGGVREGRGVLKGEGGDERKKAGKGVTDSVYVNEQLGEKNEREKSMCVVDKRERGEGGGEKKDGEGSKDNRGFLGASLKERTNRFQSAGCMVGERKGEVGGERGERGEGRDGKKGKKIETDWAEIKLSELTVGLASGFDLSQASLCVTEEGGKGEGGEKEGGRGEGWGGGERERGREKEKELKLTDGLRVGQVAREVGDESGGGEEGGACGGASGGGGGGEKVARCTTNRGVTNWLADTEWNVDPGDGVVGWEITDSGGEWETSEQGQSIPESGQEKKHGSDGSQSPPRTGSSKKTTRKKKRTRSSQKMTDMKSDSDWETELDDKTGHRAQSIDNTRILKMGNQMGQQMDRVVSAIEQMRQAQDETRKAIAQQAFTLTHQAYTQEETAQAIKTIEKRQDLMLNAIGDLHKEIRHTNEIAHNNKKEIQTNRKDIDSLKEEQELTARTINKLEQEIDRLEGQNKKHNLLVHGIREGGPGQFEICEEKIRSLIWDFYPGESWAQDTIEWAHRLGRFLPGNFRPRPILVRFQRWADVLRVLRNRQAREQMKRAGVQISQDLTTRQQAKLKALREEGKRGYFIRGRLVVTDPERTQRQERSSNREVRQTSPRHRERIDRQTSQYRNPTSSMTSQRQVEEANNNKDGQTRCRQAQGQEDLQRTQPRQAQESGPRARQSADRQLETREVHTNSKLTRRKSNEMTDIQGQTESDRQRENNRERMNESEQSTNRQSERRNAGRLSEQEWRTMMNEWYMRWQECVQQGNEKNRENEVVNEQSVREKREDVQMRKKNEEQKPERDRLSDEITEPKQKETEGDRQTEQKKETVTERQIVSDRESETEAMKIVDTGCMSHNGERNERTIVVEERGRGERAGEEDVDSDVDDDVVTADDEEMLDERADERMGENDNLEMLTECKEDKVSDKAESGAATVASLSEQPNTERDYRLHTVSANKKQANQTNSDPETGPAHYIDTTNRQTRRHTLGYQTCKQNTAGSSLQGWQSKTRLHKPTSQLGGRERGRVGEGGQVEKKGGGGVGGGKANIAQASTTGRGGKIQLTLQGQPIRAGLGRQGSVGGHSAVTTKERMLLRSHTLAKESGRKK